jgi:hypothetical protein
MVWLMVVFDIVMEMLQGCVEVFGGEKYQMGQKPSHLVE